MNKPPLTLTAALELTPAEYDTLPDQFAIEIPDYVFQDLTPAEAISRQRQMRAFESEMMRRRYIVRHGFTYAQQAYVYTFSRPCMTPAK